MLRFSCLLLLAAASVQGARVANRPGAELRPRQFSSGSSTTMASQSSQTSFASYTSRFSSVSTVFQQTREVIESQTTVQGAAAALNNLRQNLFGVVNEVQYGCNCDASFYEAQQYAQVMRQWFLELQIMIEIIIQRFPNQYQPICTPIFEQLAGGLQVVWGVGYDAGINTPEVFQGLGVNTQVLSSVHIEQRYFTSTSEFTESSMSTNSNSMFGGSLAAAGASAAGFSAARKVGFKPFQSKRVRKHSQPITPQVQSISQEAHTRAVKAVSSSSSSSSSSRTTGRVDNIGNTRGSQPGKLPGKPGDIHDPRGASINGVNKFDNQFDSKKPPPSRPAPHSFDGFEKHGGITDDNHAQMLGSQRGHFEESTDKTKSSKTHESHHVSSSTGSSNVGAFEHHSGTVH